MIILGIDPGTATTGYGIIEINKKKSLKCLGYGHIQTSPALTDGERLKIINNDLGKLINKYQPKILAVENIFFFKNLKTAMPVSQAKGVILLTAAKKRILVYEFTPSQVKMATVGYGRADKSQVQKMVKIILNLKETPKPDDAADALAVAICCLNSL
ncbi:MAG TPA: crossover junction endodeoxyribonuclease RuvC [Candidatus Parcubacteria bacterium]|jgi:crossover junction endodeoxyribonuclease RuvC|nr:crossover junction endodeoxyribonuclease RuvC [Candidatus Parcubacteria bacterium]|tara:strand:+ start:174 stop:644 length:471 start_codon:yes stop_codon:yes gene_type:complete